MVDRVSLAKHVCSKSLSSRQASALLPGSSKTSANSKKAEDNDSSGSWDGDFKNEW